MEHLLTLLYGASGLVSALLYVPQIVKYHCDSKARLSISLLAWAGWIAIALVTVLYALCVVKNYLIAGVAGLSAAAQAIVLCYGISGRLGRREAAAEAGMR